MKTVYICSPLKGDIDGNIEKVKRYTKFALKCGTAPVVSHFFALCIDDNNPVDRKTGMDAGLTLMNMCDEVWVFGKTKSEGMKKEIDYAYRKLKLPVIYITENYVEEFFEKNGGN